MSIDLILFLVLAAVAIATALGMLLSRNSVYSALFLVLNFATIAVFYLLLGAPFIAISQVTVYAGAIMVLFLFVIMLLGAETLAPSKVLRGQGLAAFGLAVVLIAETSYLLLFRHAAVGAIARPDAALNELPALQRIGEALFTSYLLPFEITSILLLVAMVGAIVLTKQEKGGQK
jgi:NADH-quinone oxidoreductase subunit J